MRILLLIPLLAVISSCGDLPRPALIPNEGIKLPDYEPDYYEQQFYDESITDPFWWEGFDNV